MKTVGSMPSLIQGVSQQEPHNRGPGKVGESVNFVDSATKGKTRRRGSIYKDHVTLPVAVAAALEEAKRMTEYTFIIDGREYTLVYRPFASSLGARYFAQLYSKTDEEFYPITYENSAWVDNLVSGGVSSLACAGRTLLIAGNTTIPTATSVNNWDTPANIQKLSGWIREGAFSRKFTAVLYRADGTKVEYSYTTKPAAYPELLDTSDISFYLPGGTDPDPEYQKKVNDRVNEYEGFRSAWIKESAEDIVPANIATKLAELMQDDDVIASSVGPCVVVDDPEFVNIRMLDDGANTLVSAVGKEISDPQEATLYHWAGKIVRVRPSGAGDQSTYYLQAVAIEDDATGWVKVEWVEVAGVVHTVNNLVSQLAIDPALKRAYIAQNAAGLETLAPTLGDFVDYKTSSVGDAITSPLPHFFGRRISCLSMFQDRLLIVADNIVSASRSQDYFNLFRATVLNILQSDPIEMFAHGSEGDIIRRAVMYDKNIVFFGELRQYAINGSEFLSPDNPNITVIGGYENGADAQPIASGDYLFFGKTADDGKTGLHELRPGPNVESTVALDRSDELDDYIVGGPVQLLGMTMPNTVFYRADGSGSIWYLYKYADSEQGRVLSSWGKFQYADVLGTVAALSHYRGDLLIFTLRTDGTDDYWFADRLSLNPALSPDPHLDSQAPSSAVTPWHTAMQDELFAAASKGTTFFLMGCPYTGIDSFIEQAPEAEPYLKVGAVSPAYFQPTNPYMRGSEGQPILSTKLTLGSYSFHLADTGGFSAYVLKPDELRSVMFEGRVIGHSGNIAGRQPVFTGTRQVSVGKETRACIVELRSKDWLPLRVTGAEWAGQTFAPRARGVH